MQLADYFKTASAPVSSAEMGQLLSLVEQDLTESFPTANAAAAPRRAADAGVERKGHTYRALPKNVEMQKVFEKDEETMWECRICGHLVMGKKRLSSARSAGTARATLKYEKKIIDWRLRKCVKTSSTSAAIAAISSV